MNRYASTALLALASILLPACPSSFPSPDPPAFSAFLERMDSAQRELQNGNPGPYKALWSHADDVTLIGGFGGKVEKGWLAVSERLDWAASQFSQGRNTIERLQVQTSGALGYVVQREQIRFVVPGETRESARSYRVTIVCRRERNEWRIVHRHADVQTTRQPPRQ